MPFIISFHFSKVIQFPGGHYSLKNYYLCSNSSYKIVPEAGCNGISPIECINQKVHLTFKDFLLSNKALLLKKICF